MYNNNYNNITPKLVKGAVIGVGAIVLLIVAMAFIRPWYNVWSQEMEGKAEFAKAEQNRKIKIEEAKANLEAEKLNAQAEIERAKGVGAPAVRPQRQDRDLRSDREQPAHTGIDTDADKPESAVTAEIRKHQKKQEYVTETTFHRPDRRAGGGEPEQAWSQHIDSA